MFFPVMNFSFLTMPTAVAFQMVLLRAPGSSAISPPGMTIFWVIQAFASPAVIFFMFSGSI